MKAHQPLFFSLTPEGSSVHQSLSNLLPLPAGPPGRRICREGCDRHPHHPGRRCGFCSLWPEDRGPDQRSHRRAVKEGPYVEGSSAQDVVTGRGDEFAQSAIAFPMVVLMLIALFNLSLAGFASVNSDILCQSRCTRRKRLPTELSWSCLLRCDAINLLRSSRELPGQSVSGGGFPGATIIVIVNWKVPRITSPRSSLSLVAHWAI